jgi:hypothetical protein
MRILLLLLVSAPLWAADELTVYELLAPSTHSFEVTYDLTAELAGAPYLFNLKQEGLEAKERVIDRASGKPLEWEIVDGRSAKATEFGPKGALDDAHYLRIKLLRPVPANAQTRIRIYKTCTDLRSYLGMGTGFVFSRSLSGRRNVVVLPKGYDLVGSASPAIVSTDSDGRTRVSFLNDRDDQLPVKIVGRKLP